MIKIIAESKKENAHAKGISAKKKGFSKTSPFYESPEQDYFFFAGYDGISFQLSTQAYSIDSSKV
jgi:hypothetical protein